MIIWFNLVKMKKGKDAEMAAKDAKIAALEAQLAAMNTEQPPNVE